MTNGLEMTDAIKEHDRIILVGYSLARCAVVLKSGVSSPPVFLNTDNWNQAYDFFFDSFSHRLLRLDVFEYPRQEFRNLLKNIHETFDVLLEDEQRSGFNIQGSAAYLKNREMEVYQKWKGQSDEKLAEHVLEMTTIKPEFIAERPSKKEFSSAPPNRITGSFSPVYQTASNSDEKEWSPPYDLPSEHEILLMQANHTRPSFRVPAVNSQVQVASAQRLKDNMSMVREGKIKLQNDEIGSSFDKIVDDLEAEIAQLNAEGSNLFRFSHYEEAMNRAELGKKLQTFLHQVIELKANWGEISVTVTQPNKTEHPQLAKTSQTQHKKSPKKSILVTLTDGGIMSGRSAAEIFANTIVSMGLERVEVLGVKVNNEPLVSDTKSQKYTTFEINGKYLMTHSSTSAKKELLKQIADKLGVGISVDIKD